MSKTQNSLRFKLRYRSHLCLLSVNPPSALSLWSSDSPSNPTEDYSVPLASLTRTYVSLCLHFPVDLFKDNHIKNPCGGMRYIFIASCPANSASCPNARIQRLCSPQPVPGDIYRLSKKIKRGNNINLCTYETINWELTVSSFNGLIDRRPPITRLASTRNFGITLKFGPVRNTGLRNLFWRWGSVVW